MRLIGLPLARIELVGGPQFAGSAVSGDMVFDAQWDAQLGAENAEGRNVRVAAGERQALDLIYTLAFD